MPATNINPTSWRPSTSKNLVGLTTQFWGVASSRAGRVLVSCIAERGEACVSEHISKGSYIYWNRNEKSNRTKVFVGSQLNSLSRCTVVSQPFAVQIREQNFLRLPEKMFWRWGRCVAVPLILWNDLHTITLPHSSIWISCVEMYIDEDSFPVTIAFWRVKPITIQHGKSSTVSLRTIEVQAINHQNAVNLNLCIIRVQRTRFKSQHTHIIGKVDWIMIIGLN